MSRTVDEAASLACRVASTRWPVSAACTASRAVSESRISPTRITSGSWRRKARSAEAKVTPAASLTWVWLMASNTYSIGSSIVIGVRVVLELAEGRVERGGLAGAGGSGHQDHAVGLADAFAVAGEVFSLKPSAVEAACSSVCRGYDDDPLPVVEGRRRDAKVEVEVLQLDDAPVLGKPSLRDVQVAHDLDPADDAEQDEPRQALMTSLEHPVDPETDPEPVGRRFDVDVRRPLGHGPGEKAVHEADDRLLVPSDPGVSFSETSASGG